MEPRIIAAFVEDDQDMRLGRAVTKTLNRGKCGMQSARRVEGSFCTLFVTFTQCINHNTSSIAGPTAPKNRMSRPQASGSCSNASLMRRVVTSKMICEHREEPLRCFFSVALAPREEARTESIGLSSAFGERFCDGRPHHTSNAVEYIVGLIQIASTRATGGNWC